MITIKGNQFIVTTKEERDALKELDERFEIKFDEPKNINFEDVEGVVFRETEHPEEVYIRQHEEEQKGPSDTLTALNYVFENTHWQLGACPDGPSNEPDPRYNVPKEKPKFSQEEIDAVIANNEIYSELKNLMNDAQREQVGYGMGKYPEPLNDETWTVVETLDHIIGEEIDKLHYLVMLKLKMIKLSKFI